MAIFFEFSSKYKIFTHCFVEDIVNIHYIQKHVYQISLKYNNLFLRIKFFIRKHKMSSRKKMKQDEAFIPLNLLFILMS